MNNSLSSAASPAAVPTPVARWKRLDPFLLGLVASVLLAWLFPEWGARSGPVHPTLLNKLPAACVFALSGLTLTFGELRAGAVEWRAHALTQATTFVLFPLLGLLLLPLLGSFASADLSLGVFYLCALPSTVSSATALTALARGNISVAIFNATISSFLGILLTPLWLKLAVSTAGQTLPLGRVFLDLCLWLLLPLVLGQVSRRWLGAHASRYRKWLRGIDRAAILLLVYTSFCDSFAARLWQQQGWSSLLISLGVSLTLLPCVLYLLHTLSNRFGLRPAERVAVTFCGATKSLMTAVLLAQLLFEDASRIGVILLPVLIYHPLQLVVCGLLAQRWAAATTPATLGKPS